MLGRLGRNLFTWNPWLKRGGVNASAEEFIFDTKNCRMNIGAAMAGGATLRELKNNPKYYDPLKQKMSQLMEFLITPRIRYGLWHIWLKKEYQTVPMQSVFWRVFRKVQIENHDKFHFQIIKLLDTWKDSLPILLSFMIYSLVDVLLLTLVTIK